MSQSSSLNPSSEESRDEILENLIIKFSEEIDHHGKSKILFLLVEAYIQYFKDELETNIRCTKFLQILSQIPILCEKFLQTSASLNGIVSVVNSEHKRHNLESASLCFDALLICLEAFCMTKEYIIIIKLGLSVLSQGYNHCKESEMIYGDMLEQFADQLGSFFKKIENLQTIVMQHLDKLDVTKYAEDDLHINFIIVEAGDLCQIVFTLDADVAFEMWTKYLRLINDHKSLKHVSNINSVSIYLATKNIEVLQAMKYNLHKNSEEDEELSAKFFFYLDALSDIMNLVNDSFKENYLTFRTLLLNLLDFLVSCYSSFADDKTGMNIIKSSLKKNTFSLISHLYRDEEFLKSVLKISTEKELHISTLLVQLCALQFMQGTSLHLGESYLRAILSSFSLNNIEDDMKLLNSAVPRCSLTKVKSEKLITLYQLAYEIITEFLKLLSDSVIQELESAVLNCLVSSSDIIYLLISDAWMYRLRYSTIEFFKDRCYTIMQNLHKGNINNDKIGNLVKRMLRFLPCCYKDNLLEAFSPLECIQDKKNIQHRFGIPDHNSTENEIKMDSYEQIKTMIYNLSENSSNDAVCLIKKACTCLELCSLFVNAAGCSEILQFLEFASELFKTDIYEVQIAILSFLKSLSKKNLPEYNQEFEKIVTHLAQLFSETMHSKNYIVRYEARNIYIYFAKCSPNLRIIQETIRKDPTLKKILKSYMSAVPENNTLPEKEKAEYLNREILMSENTKFEIPAKIVESLQLLFAKGNFGSLI